MRLTPFEKWILFLFIEVISSLIFWNLEVGHVWNLITVFIGVGRAIPIFIAIFAVIILHEKLSDIIPFKYRIVVNKYRFKEYEAHVLKFYWFFIPTWQPIDTESHKYEVQNMFGATSFNYYSSELRFDKKEEALEAIEKYKSNVIYNRNKFFERPVKETKSIEYL